MDMSNPTNTTDATVSVEYLESSSSQQQKELGIDSEAPQMQEGAGEEDIDGEAKDFEVAVANVISRIPNVCLNHTPNATGKKLPIPGIDIRPDITGSFGGKCFVVDAKHRKGSYVTSDDVQKVYRDSLHLQSIMPGNRVVPIIVNSGDKISEERRQEMQSFGVKYIEVADYDPNVPAGLRNRAWQTSLMQQFKLYF